MKKDNKTNDGPQNATKKTGYLIEQHEPHKNRREDVLRNSMQSCFLSGTVGVTF